MNRVTVDKDKLIIILHNFAEECDCPYCDNFSDCEAKESSTLSYTDCRKELLEFLEVEDNE